MLTTLEQWMARLVNAMLLGGGILLLVEAFWITWGVFARYVLRNPDELVTEATSLLLVPLAFVGIAYALQQDAFPKVTMIVDKLPRPVARWMTVLNLALMTAIGAFFTLVAGSATVRSFQSGAVSAIIEWPEFAFWAPVTFFIGAFTVLGMIRLGITLTGGEPHRGPD